MSSYGVREGTGAGEWIMGAVTRNPEALLLLAAGVALLMRSGRGPSVRRNSLPDRRNEGQYRAGREDSASGISERTSGIRERVGEAARRAENTFPGPHNAQENTFPRPQIRCPKLRALMPRRRVNMPMKPHALRLNDPGGWPTRFAIQRITLFASSHGQSH